MYKKSQIVALEVIMKNKVFVILLCGVMVCSVTGCGRQNQETDKKIPKELDEDFLQCLESELGGYLVTEKDDLTTIPLSDIKNTDKEKIAYYKGVYASSNPDNKYVIVFPKNGTYDFDIMKDFDKYFYEKFPVYQASNISSISIYIHNQNNDVDFKAIANKCVTRSSPNDNSSIPSETLDKLNNTTKMVIKSNQKELGTINDKDKLDEILNAILSSKQYGDTFLCDGNGFNFEMYDKNNKLIDTIYVWGDGGRLIPSSIHSGCAYYSITNSTDLRRIIEENTDYVFYNISDFSDTCDQALEAIYEDEQYTYYLSCIKSDQVIINFDITNLTMTLKYALNNNYISAEQVYKDYPTILMKKEKNFE